MILRARLDPCRRVAALFALPQRHLALEPVHQEIDRVERRPAVGRSRRESYLALAERTNIPELRSFVQAVVQADTYGIAIAQVASTPSAQRPCANGATTDSSWAKLVVSDRTAPRMQLLAFQLAAAVPRTAVAAATIPAPKATALATRPHR